MAIDGYLTTEYNTLLVFTCNFAYGGPFPSRPLPSMESSCFAGVTTEYVRAYREDQVDAFFQEHVSSAEYVNALLFMWMFSKSSSMFHPCIAYLCMLKPLRSWSLIASFIFGIEPFSCNHTDVRDGVSNAIRILCYPVGHVWSGKRFTATEHMYSTSRNKCYTPSYAQVCVWRDVVNVFESLFESRHEKGTTRPYLIYAADPKIYLNTLQT
ncbi:hypothetical protein DFS33DRAFT_874315 [Desarmillaria ectypa]|nr:hypothetical protein DFS33DRAFT_874315 [Desarmillaria ectypa]